MRPPRYTVQAYPSGPGDWYVRLMVEGSYPAPSGCKDIDGLIAYYLDLAGFLQAWKEKHGYMCMEPGETYEQFLSEVDERKKDAEKMLDELALVLSGPEWDDDCKQCGKYFMDCLCPEEFMEDLGWEAEDE